MTFLRSARRNLHTSTLPAACLLLAALAVMPGTLAAAEIRVAVASNFKPAMDVLARRFEAVSGHRLLLSFGATGKFYAQIRNGAPFHILLAADDETPARLERERLTVAGSRFTYATGRLALWSSNPSLVDPRGDVLRQGRFRHLAIANPQVAPYGAAAVQTLTALGLWPVLEKRLVTAENIGQTWQFVVSGNAELGFVALSQLTQDGRLDVKGGSAWVVPQTMHAPLRQDAVLLLAGADSEAARALLEFLRSPGGRELIRASGYH